MRKILVAALLAFPLVAHAGEAEKKAALELIHQVIPQETYASMIEQMTTQMLQVMPQARVSPDAGDKMKKVVLEALPYEELVGWSADIYAQKFTLDELKQLSAFYKTPVGKKAARLMPELSAEAMKSAMPSTMTRMPALLQKYGLAPGAPKK
jgi:hypothetical protein